MKKVYLRCYCCENIGDDLFVKIICDRYKNVQFIISTDFEFSEGNSLCEIPNLRIAKHNKYVYRLFKKIAKITKTVNLLDLYWIKKTDMVVTIAGSIFMEPKEGGKDKLAYDTCWYSKIKRPYFIIGTNVGPIYNDEYLRGLKQTIFKNAKDVCVRDKASLRLLNGLSGVRYAPDIIFSMKTEHRAVLHAKKQIGISVIDCDRKSKQMRKTCTFDYDEMILDIVNHYEQMGNEVTLFSFCKSEGDEEAILRIEKKAGKEIKKYFYKGNISELLCKIDEMDVIFGSRFHANILGFSFGKKVVPISYNDKTINMLKDLNFKGEFVDLQSGAGVRFEKINKSNIIAHVEELQKEANLHFAELDKELK